MRILHYKRVYFVLPAVAAYLLSALAAANPKVCERLYSGAIHRSLRGFFGRLTGWFPFSLAELVILSGIVAASVYLAVSIRGMVIDPATRADRALRLAATLLCVLSLIYTFFILLCGFNYSRETFSAHTGLEVRPSSAEELAALCRELSESAVEARVPLPEDPNGVVASAFGSSYEMAAYLPEAYRRLAEIHPILGGYTPPPKPVLLSRGMSYLDITGVYFPFTFEGNVNVDTVPYNIPATMAHELAHFKGFMREDEANFIAYLACVHSGNGEYAYSGLMLALMHSANALYAADRDAYQQVQALWSEGMLADMRANGEYWQQFRTPVATVSTAVNNAYLQANRQEAGVKSYGRMVDLLLADYRQRHDIQ